MEIPFHSIVSALSILLPLMAGLFVRQHFKGQAGVFWLYIVFAAVVQLILFWMAIRKVNNIWLMNLMMPVQSVWLVYLFVHWHPDDRFKRFFLFFSALLVVPWAVFEYQLGGRGLNHISLVIQALFFTIMSLYTLYALYALFERSRGVLHRDYRLWVILGVLFYFAGTSLLFSLGYVLHDYAMRSVWIIHTVANVGANVLYSGGFLCLSRQR